MMLKYRQQGSKKREPAPTEPLAEGPATFRRNGHRVWARMDDSALVAFAKRFIAKTRIGGRVELRAADSGLHAVLQRRTLMDNVFPKRAFILENQKLLPANGKTRNWHLLSDEEMIGIAKAFIADRGITGRHMLEKEDSGLYHALTSRRLVDASGLPNQNRRNRLWARMSDDELVDYARRFIEEKGVIGKKDFLQADRGLHAVMCRRKLIGFLGLKGLKEWAGMADSEMVSCAKELIAKEGIATRTKLERTDEALYEALYRRGLLGRIGLPSRNEGERRWAGMEDSEILGVAKGLIAKEGIMGRVELEDSDPGLYAVLLKRGLLDCVGLGRKYRNWAEMSDEEIVGYCREFVERKGIGSRKELERTDSTLYQILGRRKLLSRVIPESAHFGRNVRRGWARMAADELVAHARGFIAENRISKRWELEKADSGMYSALTRRKLLDAVFSDIESSKHTEAVRGVIESLESFGDKE